jgi:soluble lytic murein transglycosylase-like protein
MMRRRAIDRRLASLVVAGVLIAACGDSDPRSATLERERATTTSAPATSSTIESPPSTGVVAPPPAPTGPQPSVMAGATSPDELAARLVDAERRIADPATPAADVAGWGRAQQVAYRQMVLRPDWHDAVRAAVPNDVRPVMETNLHAGFQLRSMLKEPKEELPRWEIVAPPSPAELLTHYQAAEAEFGVPWTYLAAINLVETRMGRIRGLSSAGAQGPMQFMPATWSAYGEGDVNDHRDAIRAAARYLVRNGAPHDMPNALWNYNHSDKYVAAVTAYAERMTASPRAYEAYWAWQVFYVTVGGDVLLPEGWIHPEGAVTG